MWPNAELVQYPLQPHPDLTIDWIRANALTNPEKVLIFTSGQHGIEGIVGSAMLELFIKEYLPRLNPRNTGLLLVHAINPWGMQHNRHVNANNVDLNRNFFKDDTSFSQIVNKDYRKLRFFLNPKKKLRVGLGTNIGFFLRFMKNVISPGIAVLQAALLSGQYEFPQGVYFGGQQYEEETRVVMDLYQNMIQNYAQILHLDMHTGYGPRYQMSLLNSPFETRSSDELQTAFNFPYVVSTTPGKYYSIYGDMIDWVYQLVCNDYPEKRLYAVTFEFGTFGDSLPARLQSLIAIIFENQLHWHGAVNDEAAAYSKTVFNKLHTPTDITWRKKAVQDANRAFEGILAAENFYGS
jgi:hypothetical protein